MRYFSCNLQRNNTLVQEMLISEDCMKLKNACITIALQVARKIAPCDLAFKVEIFVETSFNLQVALY